MAPHRVFPWWSTWAVAGSAVALWAGCATPRLVGKEPRLAPDPGVARVVVVEPFFENAEWQTSTRTERATVVAGPYGAHPVDVSRQVAEKPLYARVDSLAAEQREVIRQVQRQRPSWRVLSPSGLAGVEGPVTVVRTVVGETETVGSNRAEKTLALGFGILLPPLLLFELEPVRETQRVHGQLRRYDADAALVRSRLLRYPTQPDSAVDTRGLAALDHAFGLDLELEEGVLASDAAREPVLIVGFARKLAAAVVAIAEEQR